MLWIPRELVPEAGRPWRHWFLLEKVVTKGAQMSRFVNKLNQSLSYNRSRVQTEVQEVLQDL